MDTNSVTYSLSFSQKQFRAFDEFLTIGNKLKVLFHKSSMYFYISDMKRWNAAFSATFIIRIIAEMNAFGRDGKECIMKLRHSNVVGLRDLIGMAHEFQQLYKRLPSEEHTPENEAMMQKFMAALAVFRDSVQKLADEVLTVNSNGSMLI